MASKALTRQNRRCHGNTRHGMSHSLEYKSWSGMRDRCLNPDDRAFGRYGGRGITICDRWRWGEAGVPGFECFLADMGPRPDADHSIERRENDKGYSPGNCFWATYEQQNRNRKNTVFVEYRGRRETLAALAAEVGADYGLTWRRIFKNGWSVERALRTPSRQVR